MSSNQIPSSFNIFKSSKNSGGLLGAAAVSTGIATVVAQMKTNSSPLDQRLHMQHVRHHGTLLHGTQEPKLVGGRS